MVMNDYLLNNGILTADYANNQFIASVSTSNGDSVVRSTKQYHAYIPGTGNVAYFTFVMDQAKTNLIQSCGLFDNYNGMYFRMNGTVPEFVVRKKRN